METRKRKRNKCECGCGGMTTRVIAMLREQDSGTASALGWAECAIDPMRERVSVIRGHEGDVPGYVYPEPEQSA